MAEYKSQQVGLTSLADLLSMIDSYGGSSQRTINEGIH